MQFSPKLPQQKLEFIQRLAQQHSSTIAHLNFSALQSWAPGRPILQWLRSASDELNMHPKDVAFELKRHSLLNHIKQQRKARNQ